MRSETNVRESRIAMAAGRQFGAFSHAQAREAGFSQDEIDDRVHRGQWTRVHRGKAFLIAGAPVTADALLMCAVLAGRPCVAARRSAGRLYGLPGCDIARPELLVDRDVRLDLYGVDVRRTTTLPRTDTTTFGRFPVTRPARTLIDLASCMSRSDLEAVIDHALKLQIVRLPALRRRASDLAGPGRRGSGVLHDILRVRASGILTESELEREFVRVMRKCIPLPEFQEWIRLRDGRRVRPEAVYRSARVALEADSWMHHSTKREWELDADKRLALRDLGWDIVPFASSDLRDNPERLARVINDRLRERGFPGPYPS